MQGRIQQRSAPDPGSRLGPQLVPTSGARPSPLAVWHLLSFDAPTVAAVWTVFLAHTAAIALPWTSPAAMFIAVWMIYAADRLLDARDANAPGLEARHRFHQRHRNCFLAFILLATPALVLLLHRMNARALHLYTLLAALLGAWMLLIHARPRHAHRLPKELAVGLFFPAAVFVPTVARAGKPQLALLPAAALFAAICTLNCLCIYAWEHAKPQPNAHWTTRWATRNIAPLSICIFMAATLAAWVSSATYIRLPAAACACTTALLFVLHTQRKRISPLRLRAAADLTLLTPLLFFL